MAAISTATKSPSAVAHFFSGGFRPFFLFGAIQPAIMIVLWIPWFLGLMQLPSAMPPVAWHQHELMFGYVPAIIAGFLLTAVPNWTGRKPLSGRPLFLLFSLWLAGRLAVACSQWIGLTGSMAVAAAFLPVLALLILRELVLAGNRRNYKVAMVLCALSAAQFLFFYEIDRYGFVEIANRLAIGMAILLIAKGVKGLIGIAKPLVSHLPIEADHHAIAALGVVLAASFVVGLAVTTWPGAGIRSGGSLSRTHCVTVGRDSALVSTTPRMACTPAASKVKVNSMSSAGGTASLATAGR